MCSVPHGIPGCSDGDVPDNPYGDGSDTSSFSEFGRWCRHDQCTQQHEQFEQCMFAMNNLSIDLLHCQQRTQNHTTCALQVIHLSQ